METRIDRFPGRVLRVRTVVVGSGAAGLSAALALARSDRQDRQDRQRQRGREPDGLLVVTEGMNMGTSRNTGSDKQTYYKQATGARSADCAYDMARDYFACGSMHGDLALTEALGSLKGFFRLVALGVPFPSDRYGEYTGYRTDHDEKSRAASAGPLTSRYMTEALERACRGEGVRFFDGCRVIRLLTLGGAAAGIVGMAEREITPENPAGLVAVLAGAVVWAAGGPSALYHNSVYPESQTCALGAPLLAGAEASNLTESQYGIASLAFRWNLSGSYQQVPPRYVSADENGIEREFLPDAFENEKDALAAQFAKGYEWPFDPAKVGAGRGSRSSEVDLAVWRETQAGRRVFLDFRENPRAVARDGLTPETVGETAYRYLVSSRALGETPVKRLRQMNEKAYRLYLSHGIDLEREPLEIGVCAQHMNGGLSCDIWYESPTLKRFYPVGECAGVFGIKRPGGSALNSTQVGSMRAAEKIAHDGAEPPEADAEISAQLAACAAFAAQLDPASASVSASVSGADALDTRAVLRLREEGGRKHDRCAAFLRDREGIEALLCETREEFKRFDALRAKDFCALKELAINRDVLVTRFAVLSSILAYLDDGGASRGSYLVRGGEELDTAHAGFVLETALSEKAGELTAACRMTPARPVPETENWFENVLNEYASDARFSMREGNGEDDERD